MMMMASNKILMMILEIFVNNYDFNYFWSPENLIFYNVVLEYYKGKDPR